MTKFGLRKITFQTIFNLAQIVFVLAITIQSCATTTTDKLKEAFKNPPETSKPGVYWYFMDGNLSRVEMTKDLEFGCLINLQ